MGMVSLLHGNRKGTVVIIWLVFLATHLQLTVGNQYPIANSMPLPIQQQQQQQEHQQRQQQHYALGLLSKPFRGGSSSGWVTYPETVIYDDPYQPPETNLEQMSLALRLTGELNRRLNAGTRHCKEQEPCSPYYEHHEHEHDDTRARHSSRSQLHSHNPRITEPLRGGDSAYMNSRSPPPPPPPPLHSPKIRGTVDSAMAGGPIREHATAAAAASIPLTVFHAKSPRTSKKGGPVRRGAARWGPDLLTYLRHLADLMGLSEEECSLEFAMAMIYMDRACSVETTRNNGMLPCPFCEPRTVHRLCLTAMLVATQAVRGTSLEEYYPGRLESLGIPLPQLQQMVDWMTGALGDLGFFLTPGQMAEWRRMWEYRFPSSSLSSSSSSSPSWSTQQEVPDSIPQAQGPAPLSHSAPRDDLEAQTSSLAGDSYPPPDHHQERHQYHPSAPTHRNAVGVE